VKDDLSHGHCDEPIILRVTMGFNCPGGVDIAQDNTTKDRSL